jgi:hypothetical protein
LPAQAGLSALQAQLHQRMALGVPDFALSTVSGQHKTRDKPALSGGTNEVRRAKIPVISLLKLPRVPLLCLSTIRGHPMFTVVQLSSSELAPYLDQLRSLPFVKAAKVDRGKRRQHSEADLVMTLQTPTGPILYVLEVKAAPLSRTVAADLLSRRRHERRDILVLSQYAPPAIAEELVAHGVQFLDAVGNQYLSIRDQYFVRSSGNRPDRATSPHHKSMRPTGYLVYFALLANPELRSAPIRTIASAAGVSKSAVSNAIARLEAQKLFVRKRAHGNWVDTRALLERWLVGYTEVVRPRLLVSGYRAQDPDPPTLEKRIEAQMPADTAWAFGGGAAAYRLTRHYRGELTVVHVDDLPADLVRRLRIVRVDSDQTPDLVLLRAPGPLLLQGVVPHTAHPLLVYTELLYTGDERAREAAAEIRQTQLQELLA